MGNTFANETVEQCDKADMQCTEESIELIRIHGVRNSIYNVNNSGDIRRMTDLVDTPQTITVLTKDQIEESGKSDLKEILASQAGVTLGTGENGNAFGDRYIIRGHEARSDVFVDGLRDPGMKVLRLNKSKSPKAQALLSLGADLQAALLTVYLRKRQLLMILAVLMPVSVLTIIIDWDLITTHLLALTLLRV
jgi:hypothetical protein